MELAPYFEIEEEVGRGGFGVVYRGRHKDLDIPVAIKVLDDRLCSLTERHDLGVDGWRRARGSGVR